MSLRIQKLRQKRGGLVDDMAKIVEKAEGELRPLAEPEIQEFDRLKGELKALDETLKRAEEIEREKAQEARPIDPATDRPKAAPPPRRYASLRAFHGEGAEERAYRSGQFLRAAIWRDAQAAAWCKEHGVPLVRDFEDRATTRAGSEGVNTAGGYLVPDEFSNAIIDLREQYGVFRGECRLVPMGRDRLSIPRRSSGLTAYFIGEGTAITPSDMTWDEVQLNAKKLAAYSLFSNELADDAVINIADWLAGEIAYAFADKEDDTGFNGTGAGGTGYAGIRGIRTQIIDGTHTAGAKDAASGHDTFGEYDAPDLATVMGVLPQYAYVAGASWYTSVAGWAATFQRLLAASGGATMDETASGPRRAYLGYPVVISQRMPTAVTDISDTAAILFGNLALAAAMGERKGISIAQSEHIKFAEDQTAIRGIERIDINVHSLGDTSIAGPMVALIAE